jgi:murein DD-endopeptidase MepM/ murein hydrolase activator NlpD
MVPTGTTVIAAKDGTIQHVNSGNEHPNSVTITNADGVNYYTHMDANSVKVRVGQKIKAGDKLGRVGTSVDALNTAPHLHFDMLPKPYDYRPACSSAACSGYPFINVQPTLIELYKKLPDN